MQTFLQKTYNILRQEATFQKRFNPHMIQCDADIQEDAVITTQAAFDAYIAGLTIKGLGGTDFRPVFHRVNELIAQTAFHHLKGLSHFTDGYGTFPEKKPDYETAFVFVDDDATDVDVPAWAIKLILRSGEIAENNLQEIRKDVNKHDRFSNRVQGFVEALWQGRRCRSTGERSEYCFICISKLQQPEEHHPTGFCHKR